MLLDGVSLSLTIDTWGSLRAYVPELGADIEAHSSSSCPLPIPDRSPLPPDGVCLPLTLVARLRLEIEKLKRDIHGSRSERKARLLEQMELQLEARGAGSRRQRRRTGRGDGGAIIDSQGVRAQASVKEAVFRVP